MADDTSQVKFGADIGDLDSAMQQVQSTVNGALGKMTKDLQNLSAGAKQASQEFVDSQKKMEESANELKNGVEEAFSKIRSAATGLTSVITGISAALAGGRCLQRHSKLDGKMDVEHQGPLSDHGR